MRNDDDSRDLSDVDAASYRWGYLVLAYGILGIVAYRAFVHDQTSWDLLALVVGGGVITTAYRATRGETTGWWRATSGFAAIVALILAAWLAARFR